jgi:hypothetical protein
MTWPVLIPFECPNRTFPEWLDKTLGDLASTIGDEPNDTVNESSDMNAAEYRDRCLDGLLGRLLPYADVLWTISVLKTTLLDTESHTVPLGDTSEIVTAINRFLLRHKKPLGLESKP